MRIAETQLQCEWLASGHKVKEVAVLRDCRNVSLPASSSYIVKPSFKSAQVVLVKNYLCFRRLIARTVQMKRTAGHAREIAAGAQQFQPCLVFFVQWRRKARHLNRDGRTSRHQRRARRHTLRRGDVSTLEKHRVFGKGVEVGCLDVRIAVRADVRCAVIVRQDQQYVGVRRGLRECQLRT